VKLRRVRVLLSDSSQESESVVSDILGEITETLAATARCRAWAHYYLGLIDVRIARQAGALQDLWVNAMPQCPIDPEAAERGNTPWNLLVRTCDQHFC